MNDAEFNHTIRVILVEYDRLIQKLEQPDPHHDQLRKKLETIYETYLDELESLVAKHEVACGVLETKLKKDIADWNASLVEHNKEHEREHYEPSDNRLSP